MINKKTIKKLYLQGLSCNQIGRKLGCSKANIQHHIRKMGIRRMGEGEITENLIFSWFKNNGQKVKHQKASTAYDLIVNGQRVDVKMANISLNSKKDQIEKYFFSLQYPNKYNNKRKDLYQHIDWLCLVFNDTGDIYEMDIKEVKRFQRSLSIYVKSFSKYNMVYLGNLKTRA